MPLQLAQKTIEDSARAMALAPTAILVKVARQIARTLADGGTIFICGNGGSAAQAQHFSAELVGRFLMERPGLPAIALTYDTSILTAVSNDYGFENIFTRQIQALMKPGDFLWGLSTSGRSSNVLSALHEAKKAGGRTLLMCGSKAPTDLEIDLLIAVPISSTPRIQELHLLCGHIIFQLIDHFLFIAPGDINQDETTT